MSVICCCLCSYRINVKFFQLLTVKFFSSWWSYVVYRAARDGEAPVVAGNRIQRRRAGWVSGWGRDTEIQGAQTQDDPIGPSWAGVNTAKQQELPSTCPEVSKIKNKLTKSSWCHNHKKHFVNVKINSTYITSCISCSLVSNLYCGKPDLEIFCDAAAFMRIAIFMKMYIYVSQLCLSVPCLCYLKTICSQNNLRVSLSNRQNDKNNFQTNKWFEIKQWCEVGLYILSPNLIF